MLFWPEISALGVFFNFDNERMHPPKYPSAPPGLPTERVQILVPLAKMVIDILWIMSLRLVLI